MSKREKWRGTVVCLGLSAMAFVAAIPFGDSINGKALSALSGVFLGFAVVIHVIAWIES